MCAEQFLELRSYSDISHQRFMCKGPEELTKIGDVYGYWTVLYRSGTQGQYPLYRCRCQCGKERNVLGKNLRNGHSSSCGCRPKGRENVSKLTAEEVKKIRELYESNQYTQQYLGELFKVTQSNIGHIVLGKTWKNV